MSQDQSAGTAARLVPAHVVALMFGGWSTTRLRVWRLRNPGVLPVAARGRRGVALYRWEDARHAADQVAAQAANDRVTSE